MYAKGLHGHASDSCVVKHRQFKRDQNYLYEVLQQRFIPLSRLKETHKKHKTQQKLLLPPFQKKIPVDFDDELKIGDVRYDDITKITIKVQLF